LKPIMFLYMTLLGAVGQAAEADWRKLPEKLAQFISSQE
jgi:hypothetical protein